MDFVNKYTEIGEHKNTFLALEAKITLWPVAMSLIFWQLQTTRSVQISDI